MHESLVRAAERQHGLITRAQMKRAKLSRDQIKRLQYSKRLVEIRPGVYKLVGTPPSWEQGLHAAVLSVTGSNASHASAARLGALPVDADRYEITTPRSRQVCLTGVRSHRSELWLPEDSRNRPGIPRSSPDRMVMDLSGRLDAKALGRLVDELLRRRALRLDRLAVVRGRFRAAPGRRPGVVDDVLAARLAGYAPGDSDLEAQILRALQAANLPMPTAQHRVKVGGARYRVDLAYPALMLAIEIDSWAYHQWRSSFDRDRAKRNDLTLLGYAVLQVTDGMTNAEIVDLVGRALATLGESGADVRSDITQRRAG